MRAVMLNDSLSSVHIFEAVKEKLNKTLLNAQFKRVTLMLF